MMSMKNERDRALEAIQFAIQMEIDGKEFYQKASKECNNKVARRLYDWLATQEDDHRKTFEQIYAAVENRTRWPDVGNRPKAAKKFATFFSESELSCPVNEAPSAELEVAAKAMDMENKTHELYESRGAKAVTDAEKKLYASLAAEEEGHYLALVDYREYLINPAGWFVKAEHHSLDGG
jgi:rubrerythrin